MDMLTVRNISDEVHQALRARAARRGHSMEAEVRKILESALSPRPYNASAQTWWA
jgi:antitoxin FitA